MTDTDTAQTDHAAWIIERCKAGDIWGTDLFAVADHAKALQVERDAAMEVIRSARDVVGAMIETGMPTLAQAVALHTAICRADLPADEGADDAE